MTTEKITVIATAVRDAADREDWENVNALMQRLDVCAKNASLTSADKAELTTALTLLSEAIQSATRRKEEIRDLVNILGSTPL